MSPETPVMITISAGPFRMGSDTGAPWERPAHNVYLDAFTIAATPVTRREYSTFLSLTGHECPAAWNDVVFSGPDQPVVGVNWFDAVAYCVWLSSRNHVEYRLPTEAEWEKACRGGLTGAEYSWGNTPPDQIEYYGTGTDWNGPRNVGERPANAFGLFNMGDNVHEWCVDWYGTDYYSSPMASENPRGPKTGTRRVSRGGSWRHQIKASRNAHRSSLPPERRYTDYGFRLAAGSSAIEGQPSAAVRGAD